MTHQPTNTAIIFYNFINLLFRFTYNQRFKILKPSELNFSIIIPVYNRPQEIDELLESLTKQDFEGTKIAADISETAQGDGTSGGVSILHGVEFAGGK